MLGVNGQLADRLWFRSLSRMVVGVWLFGIVPSICGRTLFCVRGVCCLSSVGGILFLGWVLRIRGRVLGGSFGAEEVGDSFAFFVGEWWCFGEDFLDVVLDVLVHDGVPSFFCA